MSHKLFKSNEINLFRGDDASLSREGVWFREARFDFSLRMLTEAREGETSGGAKTGERKKENGYQFDSDAVKRERKKRGPDGEVRDEGENSRGGALRKAFNFLLLRGRRAAHHPSVRSCHSDESYGRRMSGWGGPNVA